MTIARRYYQEPMKTKSFLAIASILLSFLTAPAQNKYEFRGVWIATVIQIDWPPKNAAADVNKQKADFIRQLDLHKKLGMNAMIVQVRPAADAFYPSPYEPWSEWLTGVQGQPPSPYYDPLAFMIEETHKRGMEFHAWINPYRAVFDISKSSVAPNHITRIHPGWFVNYPSGKRVMKIFDPGNKDVQDFVVNVVKDLVKRYDIDAVHMDDYFYPYRETGKEFPDEASYRRSGTKLSKEDWRRSNVDSIIRHISEAIKTEKKYCRFGISPFSVWRNRDQDPEGSDSKAGQTNYDDLYADILLWLKKGWIDYVAPQLYRPIGDNFIAYEKLLEWWGRHTYGKHLYIGHAVYRGGETGMTWKNLRELPDQIRLMRQNNHAQGSIFFSSTSFDNNPNGWNDSLQGHLYNSPALVPPMDWMDMSKPGKPVFKNGDPTLQDAVLSISLADPDDKTVRYAIYSKEGKEEKPAMNKMKLIQVVSAEKDIAIKLPLQNQGVQYSFAITSVSRNNVESEATYFTWVPKK